MSPITINTLHRSQAINSFRQQLQHARDTYHHDFFKTHHAAKLIHNYAEFIDHLLIQIWQHCHTDQHACLIAVGGYGRKELHPYSDIDILLLVNTTYDIEIEYFIRFLWDIGLCVSHSVRTVSDCAALAEKELDVITSLIDSRYLIGNKHLYAQLKQKTSIDLIWPSQQFYQAKCQERAQRLVKYDTANTNEPNIKNGRGGLRDIHTIMWITKRQFDIDDLEQLVNIGIINSETYHTIMDGQCFLWKIRYALHLLAKRQEDSLLLCYQEVLAKQFGYCNQMFREKYRQITDSIHTCTGMLLRTLS